MKTNTDQVLDWIGLSEGGYVNHPKDPGGATDRGITQRTYDAWNAENGMPKRPVRGITKATAEAIIFGQYMRPVRFDDLPTGLDYSVADFSVNSGPSRAAKELQKVLGFKGVSVDGVIGAQTLAAIDAADLEKLIFAYNAARMRFLQGLEHWTTFKDGWTARIEGRQKGFQTGDIGVLDRSIMLARGRSDIPAPTAHKVAKTDDSQITEVTAFSKVLADPAAYVPVIGMLGSLVSGDGPFQWAMAGVVLIGAAYLAVRMLRKQL